MGYLQLVSLPLINASEQQWLPFLCKVWRGIFERSALLRVGLRQSGAVHFQQLGGTTQVVP